MNSDLRNVFYDVRQILNDGGIFAFSVEFLEQEKAEDIPDESTTDSTDPYVLQSCARFAHLRWYLEQSTKDFGFETKAFQTSPLLRKHNGQDVYGALVALIV